MGFTHYLNFKKANRKLVSKLAGAGIPQKSAEGFAQMSSSNQEQVAKDFKRWKIIIHDEATGKQTTYDHDQRFKELDFMLDVLKEIAGENEVMLDYLSKYAHQGGFMNGAETLMHNFYLTSEDPSEQLVLDIDNRVKMFTKHKDGSISFQEQFSIAKIQAVGTQQAYSPTDGAIATITASSKLSTQGGQIHHTMKDIKIEAKDPVAKKIFELSSNPFVKAISWLKDKLNSLFSSRKPELEDVPHQRKKL